ncbi:MAG TPA: GtrA family protein [Polyangia bacterium]|nr:GtrA family protein [Polyangia bacterium]
MATATPARSLSATAWEWVRHHVSSILATIADYGVMVACVELAGMRPVPATVLGALVGGFTNFLLARAFAYRATQERVGGQTWRYAVVSAASLGLNAAGEHLFTDILGLQYFVARVITSVIVSNAWNYPLQRFFVFSRRAEGAKHPSARQDDRPA